MATTSRKSPAKKKKRKVTDLSPAAEVRRIRQAAGLSQRQAAARAGVTDDTWSCWERGVYPISPLKLAGLRAVMGGAR